MHQKIKMDMKRRHDDGLKFVDLRENDLCYRYAEATPVRSEKLPARRLHHHWLGPYFITKIAGENAFLLDPKTGTTKEVHRNLCRRYVYPLAGLQLMGERRKAYLSEITGRRSNQGLLQFQGMWRSKDSTELEWLDESDVPSFLVEEFDKQTSRAGLAGGV